MKNWFCLWILLTVVGCQVEGLPDKGQPLDQATLLKVERIVPSKTGYLLLEVKADPKDIESSRQLFLYNDKNKFVDGITLFGMVQDVDSDRITINHTFNDYTARGSVGFLSINYFNLTRQSKGGGLDGSFLVDSIQYVSKTRTVDIFLRKPAEQFVTEPNEIGKYWSQFTIPEKLQMPLRDLDFQPTNNTYFSITRWIKENEANSTEDFYLRDKEVLNSLFRQIIASNGN